MAYAYTPGLKVTESTIVRKVRRLPILGEVLVRKGDKVRAENVVARTDLPGKVYPINIANILGIHPEDIYNVMLKKEGDVIKKNEIIAQSKGFFGLFKSSYKSIIDGSIENISKRTGQVILREKPIPIEVTAYCDGEVIEILPKEGVIVETLATFIQGIFGLSGEMIGEIVMVAEKPSDEIDEEHITDSLKGKVIIGGSLITLKAFKKAIKTGVKGVVTGGFNYSDIKLLLNYELGVAITGTENLGTTLIVTEGFGKIDMAYATFELLKKNVGKKASINGSTQIRAGVMRPEILIPIKTTRKEKGLKEEGEKGLEIGCPVRIIRAPHFGKLGKVVSLPVELMEMPSESKVRVAEIEFTNGNREFIPRANIEIIER